MNLKNIYKSFNWTLFLPAFLLTCFGLISIYSSSIQRNNFLSFKKQLIYFFISLLILCFINLLDLRFLKSNSRIVFIFYVCSLVALCGLIFLAPAIRGVKGWYQLGPVSLDPVPLSAIVLIIVLAKYFSSRHIELQRFRLILFSGIYASLPIVLILLQPDLGSALTLIAVWIGILIFSGIKLKHLFVLGLIFFVLFLVAWKFWLADYQKQRILSFFNPQLDQQGVSWSVNQSKIAIGSGGFYGKGLGNGTQTQYGFLSEPKTDFIFSAIAEEFGFLGCFLIFCFLFWLLYEITKIAFMAQNNFLRLFASGFSFLILSQIFINIGMCVGLFPVVGLPLPFVSYGGSQIFSFYAGLGILMSLQKTY